MYHIVQKNAQLLDRTIYFHVTQPLQHEIKLCLVQREVRELPHCLRSFFLAYHVKEKSLHGAMCCTTKIVVQYTTLINISHGMRCGASCLKLLQDEKA